MEESTEDVLVSVHLNLDGSHESPVVYVFETLDGSAGAKVHAYLTLSGNKNAHATAYLCMQCIGVDLKDSVTVFTDLAIVDTIDAVQSTDDTQKYQVEIDSTKFQLNYVSKSPTDFPSMAVRAFTKPYYDLRKFYEDIRGMEEVFYSGSTITDERPEKQDMYVFTNDYASVAYSVESGFIKQVAYCDSS